MRGLRSLDPVAQCGALALLALIVLGTGLGLRDPWPADEPRFALIARDMVLTGEWLFPQVAGVPYADKPPLVMWTMAALHGAGLPLRIAFLLPSLIAALGMLALTYDLGRRLWSHRTGLSAALLLLVTLQFGLQARTAQLDAPVAFLITLGVYGLVRHALRGPHWGWYTLGGVAAGLGILTKGVGVIALLALLPIALAHRGAWSQVARSDAPAWRWALAPLAMLLVVAAWAVPMAVVATLSGDPALVAYRDEILFHQTATRYANAWAHVQPWWYYLVEVIPVFWLPLSLALPWAVPAWRRRLARRDARYLVLLATVLAMFLFFQASSGKRGVYLLPLLPPLALALAPLLPGLLRRAGVQRAAAGALALIALLLIGFVTTVTLVEPARGAALAARHGVAPWSLFWLLGALALTALAWGRLRRAPLALAGWLAAAWLAWGLVGYPMLDHARSGADTLARLHAAVPPGTALALVDWEEQYILQARRPVLHFGFRRGGRPDEVADALAWLIAAPERAVFAPTRDLGDCVDPARVLPLGHDNRRDWSLVRADAVRETCRATLATRAVRVIRPPLPLSG